MLTAPPMATLSAGPITALLTENVTDPEDSTETAPAPVTVPAVNAQEVATVMDWADETSSWPPPQEQSALADKARVPLLTLTNPLDSDNPPGEAASVTAAVKFTLPPETSSARVKVVAAATSSAPPAGMRRAGPTLG